MANFYTLREEELRLDDNLSPFNLPLFLNFGLVFEKMRKRQTTVSTCIWLCPFNRLAAIQNHALSCEHTNCTAPSSHLLLSFCSSMLNFFCLVLGSLCCWRCASFMNCKYACSLKMCPKCLCSMHVRKSKCSCGYFSTKSRLILKPVNAMKSSESCKNRIYEYQAGKTALESYRSVQSVIMGWF